MKYFLGIFFLSFCLNHLEAQEKHFVFIQSDNSQPFYVSVNGKLYSSTISGYVIIPKLTDGSYNLTIGFAQNAYPEQTFQCTIDKKDLGYNLKNFNEKGWGLFNLQTLDVTMTTASNTNVVAAALSEGAKPKDKDPIISFDKKKKDTTHISTAAVTDTANLPVAKHEDVKASLPVSNSASADTAKLVLVTEKPKAEPVNTDDVKKVSQVEGTEGVQLSYVDKTGKKTDTIQVIIPSSSASEATGNPVSVSGNSSTNTVDTLKSATQSSSSASDKSDIKFLDINVAPKKDTVQTVQTLPEPPKVMENSNCKNVATDEDYAKLRKRMAMETSDEKMISEAKKVYRNKCFTTSQIKNLSTLFLSDEGRFKFFDASFVSVADASQYSTLQSQFIDPAYVTRFKAMLQ